jgi:hypothetical protein
MRRLVTVPPRVAKHKIRDIRSAAVHRKQTAVDPKVVDLRAYAGRNVIRFPGGPPTPAA